MFLRHGSSPDLQFLQHRSIAAFTNLPGDCVSFGNAAGGLGGSGRSGAIHFGDLKSKFAGCDLTWRWVIVFELEK